MELRQLEHFLAVVEHRHFTRAAAAVFLTQSSLSASIQTLERELHTALFVRTSRTVELTAAGDALVPAARHALAAARDGRDAVDAVRGVLAGDLRLGSIQSLGGVDLGALLADYHRQFPGVHLTVRNAGVRVLVRQVLDGELDLALVDRPLGPDENALEVRHLGDDTLVLVVGTDSDLAGRKRVRLSTLGEREFVEYRTDSALRAHVDEVFVGLGITRRGCADVDTVAGVLDLVAHGVGVALLPERTLWSAPTGAVVGIRTDPAITRETLLVVARDRPPSPAAAAMLDVVARRGAGGGRRRP